MTPGTLATCALAVVVWVTCLWDEATFPRPGRLPDIVVSVQTLADAADALDEKGDRLALVPVEDLNWGEVEESYQEATMLRQASADALARAEAQGALPAGYFRDGCDGCDGWRNR